MRKPVTLMTVAILALTGFAPAAQASPAPRLIVGMAAESLRAPWRLPGDDGRDHLVYQVRVTNLFGLPLTIVGVTVRDGAGQVLRALTGDQLAQRIQSLGSAALVEELEPSLTAIVNLDVPIRPSRRVSAVTTHIHYQLAPGYQMPGAYSNLTFNWVAMAPKINVSTFKPPVIASPVRGAGWLNNNQCCQPDSGHSGTRMTKSSTLHSNEIFAIDFIRMHDGDSHSGDGSRNDEYYAWGAPVLSSTAGTVVDAADGMASIPPHTASLPFNRIEDAGGNYVVVKAGPGVFVLYGHLQQGSVAVKRGDRVKVGQRLGLLGNSGNTDGPHLHFQLMNGPDVFDADSLPYVFKQFAQTQVLTVQPDNTATFTAVNKTFMRVYPTTLSIVTLS